MIPVHAHIVAHASGCGKKGMAQAGAIEQCGGAVGDDRGEWVVRMLEPEGRER
jgi:hypothetical protein